MVIVRLIGGLGSQMSEYAYAKVLENKGYDLIDDDNDYKYLRKMPMDSVSEEEVTKLTNQHNDKEQDLEFIKSKTIQEMWINDLEELNTAYIHYKNEREKTMINPSSKKVKTKKIKGSKLKLKKLNISNT